MRAALALLLLAAVVAAAPASVTLPLYGGIDQDGGFFAPLALGTPQQPFRLQIDTGSADLLVFSEGCKGCTAGTTRFNYGASSTARRVLCDDPIYDCAQSGCQGDYCDFDDQYGDGSHVAGQVITDVFNLGGGLHANISFGMILNSSQNFEPAPFDGIWGLAWYTISDWNGTSAFQNVVNQLGLENRFSMCLTPQNPTMVLGGPNDDSSYTWTNVIKKLYYVVQFNDLQVNGESLGLPASAYNGDPGAIVDSGTTLFILPNAAYTALYNSFNALCSSVSLKGVCGVSKSQSIFAGGGASKCVQMSQSDIDAFPKLSVILNGAEPLSIDGNTYLIEISSGCYSMGIAGNNPSGTIMGDVFMQAFNVIFDRANMRVGFAPLSTSATTTVTGVNTNSGPVTSATTGRTTAATTGGKTSGKSASSASSATNTGGKTGKSSSATSGSSAAASSGSGSSAAASSAASSGGSSAATSSAASSGATTHHKSSTTKHHHY